MAQTYLIINTHEPEQCEPMEADMDRIPDQLKGKDFYCTCPHGQHGYYLFVDAESSDQAIETLPPSLRIGDTRAQALEVLRLPS
jgi:hypothetical protein